MKRLIGIVLLVSLWTNGQAEHGEKSFRQIISGTTLMAAGCNRLTDIFYLIDGWHSWSIDGFRWQTGQITQSTFQEQRWILMLDGQRIDLKMIDEVNLNLLPVLISQIDSVEVMNGTVYNGESAGWGLIDIHTKKPAAGFFFHGHYAHQNETGDPGPYRYTPYRSENVDQVGPDYSGAFSYARDNFFIRVSAVTLKHPATDRAIRRRHPDLTWSLIRVRSSSQSLQMGFTTGKVRHHLFCGYGATGAPMFIERPGSELFYFDPVGSEIPVQSELGTFVLRSSVPISATSHVQIGMNWSSVHLTGPHEWNGGDFQWHNSSIRGHVEWINESRQGLTYLGGGVTDFRLQSGRRLADNNAIYYKMYARGRLETSPRMDHSVDIFLATTGDKTALKASLSNRYRFSRLSFGLSVLAERRLFEEDNSIWMWYQRGYDTDVLKNTDLSLNSRLSESGQWQTIVSTGLQIDKNLQVDAFYNYRVFADLTMERYLFRFDSWSNTPISSPVIIDGVSGHVHETGLTLQHHNAVINHEFALRMNKVVRGDALFRQGCMVFPRLMLSYRASITPVDDLTFWAMIKYWTETQWNEYLDVSGAEPVHARLKNPFLLDLAVQKWMWFRRVRAHLLCRNVFDGALRYFPIGATFNLTLNFQLEFYFKSR